MEKKGNKTGREEKVAEAAPKERKRKRDKETNTTDAVDMSVIADEKPPKREKRKCHEPDAGVGNNGALDDVEVVDEECAKKKRKKRRDKDVYGAAATAAEGVEEPEPKKQKKTSSKHKAGGAQEAAAGSDVEAASRKKKIDKESRKKSRSERRKNNGISSLPDPAKDAELKDKARGAMTYAFTRLSSPESWKFNKAHQNWIVKHFFTPDAIPETYLPIIVGYLAGCQGGVRENLVQGCNRQLEPHVLSSESATSSDPVSALADMPVASVGSTSITSVLPKSEIITLSPEMQETVNTRARVLLKALGNA